MHNPNEIRKANVVYVKPEEVHGCPIYAIYLMYPDDTISKHTALSKFGVESFVRSYVPHLSHQVGLILQEII